MPYIEIPVETEPVDLAEEAFSYIESQVPGWLPSPPNLEAWLIEALAQIAAELRTLAALVPDSIFQYLGESILGLPPYPAVAATGETTWTARDAAGYRVNAGTLLAVTPPASQQGFAFEVVDAFDIVGGTTKTDVLIRALEPGAAASGISGSVEMLDTLDFIESVTLEGPTTGGSDAEAADAYLDRLSDLLTLLSPRPILPQDFALLTQRTFPAVARATALDLYNPDTGDTNCPRCVTVAIVDEQGNPLPAQVKADVDAFLQAEREVNFLTFVVDPSYATIGVTFTAASYPGYDPAEVLAQAIAALESWLSPASWGRPTWGDPGASGAWINDTRVRKNEVIDVLNRVDGLYFVDDCAVWPVSGGTQSGDDVEMTGIAPLPRPQVDPTSVVYAFQP